MKHQRLLESIKSGKPTRGLTFDEIAYMRAYTTARIEMEKGQVMQATRNLMHTGSLTGNVSWVSRMLSCFSYFDYFLIAFKTFSALRTLTRRRR